MRRVLSPAPDPIAGETPRNKKGSRQCDLQADEDLIALITTGEIEALAALYDRHSSLLYGLAVRMLQDASTAEAVLQEAFVRAWVSAPDYDALVLTPQCWLLRILRSCALERLRERNVDEVVTKWMTQSPRPDGDKENTLAALPREQRELIECAFFTGATPLAMSNAFHLPVTTVNDRIRVGMRNLRLMLSCNGQSAVNGKRWMGKLSPSLFLPFL